MIFLAKINETEQLIDIIHEQNNIYITIMLAIFAVVFGVQWYLNAKQVKEIKKEILIEVEDKHIKELRQTFLKQTETIMNSIIDQAKTKINYLSNIDNDKIAEIKFITEDIENHVSLIQKSPDISNECLIELVNEIDKNIKSIGPIDNSNDLIIEALQRIRKAITFNVDWRKEYEKAQNEY